MNTNKVKVKVKVEPQDLICVIRQNLCNPLITTLGHSLRFSKFTGKSIHNQNFHHLVNPLMKNIQTNGILVCYLNKTKPKAMHKPALTDKNIHPLLKNRWSPRSFDSRPVEADKLQRIFEAARWAPSSFNEQPWRFMLGIKGDETWDKIYDSLLEWNRQWAVTAPVLVMAIGSTHYDKTGKESDIYKYDVGQAIAHLTFQVMEEGLVMHQMGGFSKKKAIAHFDIPGEFQALTVSAIGYQAAPEQLPEEFAKMEYNERRRNALNEQVFSGRFGQASPLAK